MHVTLFLRPLIRNCAVSLISPDHLVFRFRYSFVVSENPVPIPEFLFERMLGRAGLSDLPSGAVNHIKYSITVDDSEFREKTGFDPKYDESRVMHIHFAMYDFHS